MDSGLSNRSYLTRGASPRNPRHPLPITPFPINVPPNDLSTPTTAIRPDGDLLLSFSQGDTTAMAELINRHGRMVLRTCQRLLLTDAQAELATQAVFVSLARNSDHLRHEICLAAWLHRAAVMHVRSVDFAHR
jgi:hypothetical protein